MATLGTRPWWNSFQSRHMRKKMHVWRSHESIHSPTSYEDMLRTLQYLLTSNFHGRLQAPESALLVLHSHPPSPTNFIYLWLGVCMYFFCKKPYLDHPSFSPSYVHISFRHHVTYQSTKVQFCTCSSYQAVLGRI